METAYQWKTGVRTSTSAEVAAKEFDRLRNTSRGLTAEHLVDESRPENAPMHNDFEWRDDVAAEQYRKQQAHSLICGLEIVYVDGEKETATRVNVNFKDSSQQYEHIEEVLIDTEKRDLLFDMAMKELQRFQLKYSTLQQFAGIFDEINRLKEGMK